MSEKEWNEYWNKRALALIKHWSFYLFICAIGCGIDELLNRVFIGRWI